MESIILGGVEFHILRHVMNLILHSTVTMMLHASPVLSSFKDSTRIITTLVFAIHPVQSEAIISLYGRADLLALLFILIALRSNVSKSSSSYKQTVITYGAGILAVLSKETGIAVFPLLAIQNLVESNSTKKCRSVSRLRIYLRETSIL